MTMTPEERRKHLAEKQRIRRASPEGQAYRIARQKDPELRKLKNAYYRTYRADPINKAKHQRISHRAALKRHYNITLEDWDQMLIAQSGRCAICNEPMNPDLKEPVVDHDHQNGKIRGLLHNNCNAVLGLAKESTELLSSAIAYLHAHS